MTDSRGGHRLVATSGVLPRMHTQSSSSHSKAVCQPRAGVGCAWGHCSPQWNSPHAGHLSAGGGSACSPKPEDMMETNPERLEQLMSLDAPGFAPIEPFPAYGRPISLDGARTIALDVAAEARRNGWRMAVAVVEPSGELVLLEGDSDMQCGAPTTRHSESTRRREVPPQNRGFRGPVRPGWAEHARHRYRHCAGGRDSDRGRQGDRRWFGVSGETAAQDARAATAGIEAQEIVYRTNGPSNASSATKLVAYGKTSVHHKEQT